MLSCDAYDDLWPPFFSLLTKHWPDCPFQVYLGTERKTYYGNYGLTTLHSHVDRRDWSGLLIDYLGQISNERVLIMLEDFFMRSRVATDEVMRCLQFSQIHKAVQTRLIPRPPPTTRMAGEDLIGECELGSPYRLCAQAAIWDRRALRDLLRPGESIWQFEREGNKRASMQNSGFYSVWRSVLPYEGLFAHHVVEKGKWLPFEKWIFGRQEIGCDFGKRATLPWRQVFFYYLARGVDQILDVFPWRAKAWMKRCLKALLRPFFRRSLERLGRTPSASQIGPE